MRTPARKRFITALLIPCAFAALVALGANSLLKVDAEVERIADLRGLNETFVEISANASKAVVFIQAEARVERTARSVRPRNKFEEELFRRFSGPNAAPGDQSRSDTNQDEIRPIGQGTGFIISEDGYIVTNHHVIGNADQVRVKLTDGSEYLAEVVGSDEATEIALLRIDENDLPTVALGDSDALNVGEWALAIGNPFGLSHSVTAGIISAKGRGEVGITNYADFIQTDAAINPGNSGGPLINIDGEVIGLNTAIYSRTGGYMGIGFAVPINMVRHVTDQLRNDGKITRGFLGISIQNITPELADWFDTKTGNGIIIAEVHDDSPASLGGLERDDIIIELDGRVVDEMGSFRSRIATTSPGEKVNLKIVRNGNELKKVVEVGALDTAQTESQVISPAARLGIELDDLTPDLADQLGYRFEEGIVIKSIEANSAAQRAGLRPGMLILEINRHEVTSVDTFNDVIARSESIEPVLLLVQYRGRIHYLIIRP